MPAPPANRARGRAVSLPVAHGRPSAPRRPRPCSCWPPRGL